ncbi:hypothetical protein [Actinomadura sp. SCN-SB]|uniref:hypothetical protein n=1 Tax=Actinomadura sp. SCN-SB TaxID=3373092 RepID=UPI003751CDFF
MKIVEADRMPQFSQYLFSQKQLAAGLHHAVDRILLPYEPVAATGLRAVNLEQRSAVQFQRTYDDLGVWALLAHC